MTTQELISARSNEANLGQEEFAWLLFGIHDKTHAVLGSSYKPTRPSLDALKREIAEALRLDESEDFWSIDVKHYYESRCGER